MTTTDDLQTALAECARLREQIAALKGQTKRIRVLRNQCDTLRKKYDATGDDKTGRALARALDSLMLTEAKRDARLSRSAATEGTRRTVRWALELDTECATLRAKNARLTAMVAAALVLPDRWLADRTRWRCRHDARICADDLRAVLTAAPVAKDNKP
jgi:hypothetical protein